MDFENAPEPVNSEDALPQSDKVLKQEFNIPSIKYMHDVDDATRDTTKNADITMNDQNSTSHDGINRTELVRIKQEPGSEQSRDNRNTSDFLHSAISADSKEFDRSLLVKAELKEKFRELDSSLLVKNEQADTDLWDNLERSNNSSDSRGKLFDDSGTEEEQVGESKEFHQTPKIADTDSHDEVEHLTDSSDSKSKLSNDSTADEEQNEQKYSEPTEHSFSCNQATRRTRRSSKRKRTDGEECCPVCGVTVRLPELDAHFSKEVENLTKIQKSLKKPPKDEKGISTTFVQVKSNRENRLSAKVARYAARDKNEVQCPVCHLRMTASQQEINRHVLNCINEDEDSDELVVVDDDEDSFEEYEFADQTRVRAISFVQGGYKSLMGQSSRHKTTNEDEDLEVDVDDTMTYGKPQYTEMDVIHTTSNVTENNELQQLRKAVLQDPTVQAQVLETRKWLNDDGEESKDFEQKSNYHIAEPDGSTKNEIRENKENPGSEEPDHVVSSLKEKIRDLEEQNKSVKCLICLEPYTKPVVSTTCWHVHCEECWLMTMGVKKLCPQCNMIVFPSDLRRIYL